MKKKFIYLKKDRSNGRQDGKIKKTQMGIFIW